MAESILFDIGVILVAVTAASIIGGRLGQPHVLSYLIAGVVIGPSALGLIENQVFLEGLSELGIAFLLFLVGLRLEIDEFRDVGGIAVLVAVVQMLTTGAVTFAVLRLTSFELVPALYISLATVFSSTALVIKVIEEKQEEETLYSRIDLGVLLVQDLVVVLILAGLASFSGGLSQGIGLQIGVTMLYGVLLVAASIGAARYLLPRLFKVFATSQEAFFVAGIGWCLGMIIVAEQLGLSLEIGSFLAGLSLGQLKYNEELKERVRPLTDVFLAFFFASLGLRIDLAGLGNLVFLAAALSLVVMAVKFLTISATLHLSEYPMRTSVLSGISLAQISEFSFVLMAVGAGLGHIGGEVIGLVTLVGLLTIGASSYLMVYSDRIIAWLDIGLTEGEMHGASPATLQDHIVLVGCHVQGHELLDRLEERGEDVLVVDYNPRIVERLAQNGHNAIYGDIGDLKPRKDVGLHEAKMVISTIPNVDDTKLVINKAQTHGIPAIVTAETVDIALDMYNTGADFVIFPDRMSASKISDIVGGSLSGDRPLEEFKQEHRAMLEEEKRTNGIWYEVFEG